MLTIDAERSGSATTYKIVGELKPVLEAIAKLIDEYHPLGYGTQVQKLFMDTPGTFVAQMWRRNSCD